MGVRGTRALLGAFGAGTSLAMASSVALLMVSSLVAFRGWPDDVGAGSPSRVAHLSAAAPVASQAARGGETATASIRLPRAVTPVTAAAQATASRKGTTGRSGGGHGAGVAETPAASSSAPEAG